MDGQTKCFLFIYFVHQSIQQIEKFLTFVVTEVSLPYYKNFHRTVSTRQSQ
jgi:hypothetical protein